MAGGFPSTRGAAGVGPDAQPFAAAGDIEIGASLGLAVYPDDAQTLDRLLTASDAAMYADKQRQR